MKTATQSIPSERVSETSPSSVNQSPYNKEAQFTMDPKVEQFAYIFLLLPSPSVILIHTFMGGF